MLALPVVLVGLLLLLHGAAAACDTSLSSPVNVRLGLFVSGDYESNRIQNSVQLALQSVPLSRYGVTLNFDTVTLNSSNSVYLDGCFHNTSSLDPTLPANNPSSPEAGVLAGITGMLANGVHVRTCPLSETFIFCIATVAILLFASAAQKDSTFHPHVCVWWNRLFWARRATPPCCRLQISATFTKCPF